MTAALLQSQTPVVSPRHSDSCETQWTDQATRFAGELTQAKKSVIELEAAVQAAHKELCCVIVL
jgi:hypothetical protein